VTLRSTARGANPATYRSCNASVISFAGTARSARTVAIARPCASGTMMWHWPMRW
jgi:hypothetical protein